MDSGTSIYELITVGVISCTASIFGMLVIQGIKQKRSKEETPNARMIEFMTEIKTVLENMANSHEKIANSQQDFNISIKLLFQTMKRLPEDMRVAIKEAINRDNGHGRRFYDDSGPG